jgi:hypothetical protein
MCRGGIYRGRDGLPRRFLSAQSGVAHEQRQEQHAARGDDENDPEKGAKERRHGVVLCMSTRRAIGNPGSASKLRRALTAIALSYLSRAGTSQCDLGARCHRVRHPVSPRFSPRANASPAAQLVPLVDGDSA